MAVFDDGVTPWSRAKDVTDVWDGIAKKILKVITREVIANCAAGPCWSLVEEVLHDADDHSETAFKGLEGAQVRGWLVRYFGDVVCNQICPNFEWLLGVVGQMLASFALGFNHSRVLTIPKTGNVSIISYHHPMLICYIVGTYIQLNGTVSWLKEGGGIKSAFLRAPLLMSISNSFNLSTIKLLAGSFSLVDSIVNIRSYGRTRSRNLFEKALVAVEYTKSGMAANSQYMRKYTGVNHKPRNT